jgi:wobble nucleotide-excising tRNase
MLRRVIAIKNVGRFRNSVATPNPGFAKRTFIFGGNGFGKTTFSVIMRSVQSGDAAPVLGRQTLGSSQHPEIDLLFANGNCRLQNGTWSATAPKISVFDAAFVAANVHSGDVVDVAHRRNLYRVIVGTEGVGLAEQEQPLAEEARAKQAELTATERAVQALIPQGNALRDFLDLPADPEINTKIEAQRQIVNALKQAESIRTRPALTPLSVPAMPATTEAVLAKSLDGVAADAEATIAAHIQCHGMPREGERWIGEGMRYVVEDSCPYCGRDGLSGLDLIKAYRAHFSDAYRALQSEVADVRAKVERAFGVAAQAQVRITIERTGNLLEFWQQHCAVEPANLPAQEETVARMQEVFTQLTALLDRKATALMQPIFEAPELTATHEHQTQIVSSIAAYNSACTAANLAIQTVKTAAGGDDPNAAEVELLRLKTIKRRHDPASAAVCDRYRQLDAEKRDLERRKGEVREELEAHTARVIRPYEDRINYFLDLFNAGFKIMRTDHGYPGGIATSTYQLSISDIPVELGDSRTPIDRPSFKNTLSAGDRATLALAFFLAHLEREPDLAERIVIFDDPFNSQDSFRRHQTIYEIMRTANACAQIIVLSHDANFLQQLWLKCPPDERTAAQIIYHPTTGSKLATFDLEDACRGRARAELDDLLAFRATGAGNLREIIKKLRVVLETFFRSNFPGSFLPEDNLGAILQKIRAGGAAHPAHSHYDTLERINDYTANYHHGEDARGAAEPVLDPTELIGYVKTTLKTVNALPA